jgi:hypothetical protein
MLNPKKIPWNFHGTIVRREDGSIPYTLENGRFQGSGSMEIPWKEVSDVQH